MNRLMQYPPDVAIKAVRDWPDSSKWFPTWAEIREVCEKLMGPRRVLEAALKREAQEASKPREKDEKVAASFKDLAAQLRDG